MSTQSAPYVPPFLLRGERSPSCADRPPELQPCRPVVTSDRGRTGRLRPDRSARARPASRVHRPAFCPPWLAVGDDSGKVSPHVTLARPRHPPLRCDHQISTTRCRRPRPTRSTSWPTLHDDSLGRDPAEPVARLATPTRRPGATGSGSNRRPTAYKVARRRHVARLPAVTTHRPMASVLGVHHDDTNSHHM